MKVKSETETVFLLSLGRDFIGGYFVVYWCSLIGLCLETLAKREEEENAEGIS